MLSVAVAVRLKFPPAVGVHVTLKGAVTPVPNDTPLAKNWMLVIVAPAATAVAVAETVVAAPTETVAPDTGAVIATVGAGIGTKLTNLGGVVKVLPSESVTMAVIGMFVALVTGVKVTEYGKVVSEPIAPPFTKKLTLAIVAGAVAVAFAVTVASTPTVRLAPRVGLVITAVGGAPDVTMRPNVLFEVAPALSVTVTV